MQRDEQISRVIFAYATRIGEARETDAVLRLNADMARDLVGADRCSIWLIDDKNQQLWTKVAHGMPEIRIPLGQGLAGACIDGNETIVVNDTTQDARFLKIDSKGGYETKSVLAMPLNGSDGKVIGALQALNKPGGFSQEDVDLLGGELVVDARGRRLLLRAHVGPLVSARRPAGRPRGGRRRTRGSAARPPGPARHGAV